jgi:hypothetical protein
MTSWASTSELRQYLPQVPESGQQLVTLTGLQSGDTWALVYEGAQTATFVHSATATTVQTALRAIPAIGQNVTVTGRPGGPYTVTFAGTLASDAAPLSALLVSADPLASVSVAPATDRLLESILDRATGVVRDSLRALLADPAFDYAAFGAPSTAIVLGVSSVYLRIPGHAAGSVTLVEWEIAGVPPGYTALVPGEWTEQADGSLYRPAGWVGRQRYRVTAAWGYGAPPPAIVEVVLEQAVNEWRSRDKGGFSETVNVDGQGAVRVVSGLNTLQMQTLIAVRNQLIAIGV